MKRCFSRLFRENAKECSICSHSAECKSLTSSEKARESSIRVSIQEYLKSGPKTIEEISRFISEESTIPKNRGTSVFYHLALLKQQGLLQIKIIDGEKRYLLFDRRKSDE